MGLHIDNRWCLPSAFMLSCDKQSIVGGVLRSHPAKTLPTGEAYSPESFKVCLMGPLLLHQLLPQALLSLASGSGCLGCRCPVLLRQGGLCLPGLPRLLLVPAQVADKLPALLLQVGHLPLSSLQPGLAGLKCNPGLLQLCLAACKLLLQLTALILTLLGQLVQA